MARILLGVTGGISAYKAVELARLADQGRPLGARDPDRGEPASSSGAATFEGITGAPVLSREFERDPAGGAYPGEPRPDHDPISHLELVAPLRRLLHRAGERQHDRQAGRRARPTTCVTAAYLACPAPVIVAPAMNNRMYEHPATQANLGAAARARRACGGARRGARSPRAASGGWAAWPSRPTC